MIYCFQGASAAVSFRSATGVHLNEVGPNDALVHVLLALLVTVHFLRQVTTPAELHDNAQLRVALQLKRIRETNRSGMIEQGKKGGGVRWVHVQVYSKVRKLKRSVFFILPAHKQNANLIEECLQEGDDVWVPH